MSHEKYRSYKIEPKYKNPSNEYNLSLFGNEKHWSFWLLLKHLWPIDCSSLAYAVFYCHGHKSAPCGFNFHTNRTFFHYFRRGKKKMNAPSTIFGSDFLFGMFEIEEFMRWNQDEP